METFTDGSASACCSACRIAPRSALLSALRFSGRFIVRRRMPGDGSSISRMSVMVVPPRGMGRPGGGRVNVSRAIKSRSGADADIDPADGNAGQGAGIGDAVAYGDDPVRGNAIGDQAFLYDIGALVRQPVDVLLRIRRGGIAGH